MVNRCDYIRQYYDKLQLNVSKYKFYSNKLDIEVKVKLVIAEMYGREMLLHLKMNDVIYFHCVAFCGQTIIKFHTLV